MKRSIILILLLGFALFVGCNNGQAITENTTTATSQVTDGTTTGIQQESTTESVTTGITETTATDIPDEKRGYGSIEYRTYADEDMKRLGVDKKLVVTCNWQAATIPEEVTSKFNELLVNKYGCDFVVEFIGFEMNAYAEYAYGDALNDMKALGQQTDIIVTAGDEEATYTSLVNKGMLVELTDILKNTEDGRKISESLSDVLLKPVDRNGKVYGISRATSAYKQYAVVCNKELADSLGMVVKEGFSLEDIVTMLESVSGKLAELGLIGVYSRLADFENSLGYVDMLDMFGYGRGVYAKRNDAGEWVAFNPLYDDAFVQLCHTISMYRQNGWLYSVTDHNRVLAEKIDKGEFVFYIDCVNDSINAKQIIGNKMYTDKTGVVDVVVGQMKKNCLNQVEDGITGIASWSQYKDEALKLLRLFQTEEEIINLLTFGIEDKNYVYVNKEVIPRSTNIYKDAMRLFHASMLNKDLTYPQYLEPDNKAEFYRGILNEAEEGPLLKYGITYMEYADILEDYDALKEIYKSYLVGLLNGNYEDVDGTIAEVIKMQEEAGINELIDKLNKRFTSGVEASE